MHEVHSRGMTERDDTFTALSVQRARENVAEGGKPFACLLVRDGEVVVEATNHVAQTGDPTAHAEIRAIRLAAEQGIAPAQYQLGLRYANGDGVTRDFAEAVRWYRRAAEQGVAFAQFNLGVRYANGQGVARDPVLAYQWFSVAARSLLGKEADTARQARDSIKAQLNPEQLVVLAASSCQLLSFLALAARARIDVVAYEDDAEAEMPEDDPPVRLTRIVLRPRITVVDGPSEARVLRLVRLGHQGCYVASSLRTDVEVEPTITFVPAPS